MKSTAQTTFCAKVLLDNSIQNETVQMLRSQSHCHTIHIHTLGEIDEGEQLKLLILQESSNLHKTCQLTKCSFAFFFILFASLLYTHTHTHFFLPPSFNAQTQTNCWPCCSDLVKFLCVPLCVAIKVVNSTK